MQSNRFTYLFNQWIDNTISPEEIRELTALLQLDNEADTKALLEEGWESFNQEGVLYDKDQSSAMLNAIRKQAVKESDDIVEKTASAAGSVKPVSFIRAWFKYAAVLLLVIGASVYLYMKKEDKPSSVQSASEKIPEIVPGGDKAVLTLADGTSIVLDSAANGSLLQQGGMRIVKLDNGQVRYELLDNAKQAPKNSEGIEVAYNTISTPKGGQYQVVLIDGTKVWLNAASSIRFPTTFTNSRTVHIEGEAYFEVAPDKLNPFLVQNKGGQITVLGTSFNVNAYYSEETVKTTLFDGIVKVNGLLLKPGQACVNGQLVGTNTEQDIAWKNGVFDFNKMSLRQAMQQIANWYDVEVKYVGAVPAMSFWGKMKRDLSLSEVLDFLQLMGVHFRLEGRCIIINE